MHDASLALQHLFRGGIVGRRSRPARQIAAIGEAIHDRVGPDAMLEALSKLR